MEPILLEVRGAIGCITLNRPAKYNSFTRELALALQAAIKTCAADDQIRVIYLTGAGKAFCAGQDLGEITQEDAPSLSTILSEHLNPLISLIRETEKPFVAAVNGVAAGAGANLALACDLTVATAAANFIQAFSKIGLIPDSGGTFFLPRLVGLQRAAAYMMLGDKIPAAEAARVGMIYAAFPDEDFATEAWQLAERLALLPPRALGLTKRALNQALDNDLDRQLAVEEQLQSTAGQTADYQEGVQAFLEKRKPVFTGK
ncbi:MAG: 2-(1,2-epoxy-1,2-dihydrophenyl)acetyl-CoA isomerase [Bacteroidetes bacterium]|nr:MAG: 2-(1,2-epoxy-1,2-dihydrophenyl)acetyl-CoA isomerase [Bacteroidota bacterium]